MRGIARLSLVWNPKGLHRIEITPPLHAVVLQSFRIPSNVVYFRNLGWIRDSGGHLDHRMCASTWRSYTCDTGVFAPSSTTTLRSATSASSTSLVRER
jgi:hypothetical protein